MMDLFMNGLEHFAPFLKSGLQKQKWIHYDSRSFSNFLKHGTVLKRTYNNYPESIAHRQDVQRRVEIIDLMELVLRKGKASQDEKANLIAYIEQAMTPGMFRKATGLTLYQHNTIYAKRNQEALRGMKK